MSCTVKNNFSRKSECLRWVLFTSVLSFLFTGYAFINSKRSSTELSKLVRRSASNIQSTNLALSSEVEGGEGGEGDVEAGELKDEIARYRAVYEAGEDKMAQAVLYNDNYRPYTTRELYTPGFRVANPALCPENGKHVQLLVLVITTADRSKHREVIRKRNQMQGITENIKVAFLIGIPKTEEELESVIAEQKQFGDVIVNNIRDIYPHLSLKVLSGLDWTLQYCRNPDYFHIFLYT